MKNPYNIFVLLALLTIVACSKSEDNIHKEIALKSKSLLSFELLEVPNGATGVKLTPTLSWEPLEHPNGDSVTYDLYLGTNPKAPTIYESDIEGTVVEIGNKLQLSTKYYWKVIAKDGKGMRIGSKLRKFTTRMLNCPSEPITAAADFTKRVHHTSVVFDNKIWAIGGLVKANIPFINDVWYSSDGEHWELATAAAEFSTRRDHTSVVFNDKIWVIGGVDIIVEGIDENYSLKNDVWYSTDGANWQLATEDAGFPATRQHASVVFDNKIWVIGGHGSEEAWYSGDGVNWTLATDSLPFPYRVEHTMVVFGGKIWVIGGNGPGGLKNDVWFSYDGIDWEQATASADFPPLTHHTSAVLDNKIWIIGGSGDTGWSESNLWYSSDGINWEQAKTACNFLKRFGHTSPIFNNKLWVIAGHTVFQFDNDIWALD